MGYEWPLSGTGPKVRLWPARLIGHRQLSGIGTKRQLFDRELEGFDFWSVPFGDDHLLEQQRLVCGQLLSFRTLWIPRRQLRRNCREFVSSRGTSAQNQAFPARPAFPEFCPVVLYDLQPTTAAALGALGY
jgi:hypothetical protein